MFNERIVLASTSIYRRELLKRLNFPFICVAPNIDETPKFNESAENIASRLALEKAKYVSTNYYPDSLVLASDQTCECKNQILGKPKNFENAFKQLKKMSGEVVNFYAAITIIFKNSIENDLAKVEVKFRKLSDGEIVNYLEIEKPFNCSGSIKSEGLGISLLDYIKSEDPTALIGLPLIKVCRILRKFGYLQKIF